MQRFCRQLNNLLAHSRSSAESIKSARSSDSQSSKFRLQVISRLLFGPASDNPQTRNSYRRLKSTFQKRNIAYFKARPPKLRAPWPTPTMAPQKPTIELTDEEAKVRLLLVDVAQDIDVNRRNQSSSEDAFQPLELRITGGWVRDKLLRGKSNDIDVGINLMTGFDFASHLSTFLGSNLEKYGIPARSIHKIESNPEKSKHLETATTKIMGLDIDFVNLRSETYSEESRIPQMEFGTPREDALRRDATVNALFYNLQSQEVEDFTELGLQDMQDRLIRTPLAPFETFHDDPLRVLRLIRFASRLQFTIVPEVAAAMSDPQIKEALKLKISRERIGTEVEKMLYGEHPFDALKLIYTLNLYDCIFEPPLEAHVPGLPRDRAVKAAYIVRQLSSSEIQCAYPRIAALVTDLRDKVVCWIISAVVPWQGRFFEADRRKDIPAAATAAREGIKLKNKDFESLVRCFRHAKDINYMVSDIIEKPAVTPRSKIGTLIRKCGSEWQLQVFASLLLDLLPGWCTAEECLSENGTPLTEDLETIMKEYTTFLLRVEELKLEDAWDFKPLLNGKELQTALERKPGKWMTDALETIMLWQMDHPEGSPEAALEHLKEVLDSKHP